MEGALSRPYKVTEEARFQNLDNPNEELGPPLTELLELRPYTQLGKIVSGARLA